MMNTRKVAPTDYYEHHTMPRKIIAKRPARPKTISSKDFGINMYTGGEFASTRSSTSDYDEYESNNRRREGAGS
ncbi:unnamed protein product [Rotaria sp. Silwood1]|nr:unnamed protein product [Rotaria sp. Silwood1]